MGRSHPVEAAREIARELKGDQEVILLLIVFEMGLIHWPKWLSFLDASGETTRESLETLVESDPVETVKHVHQDVERKPLLANLKQAMCRRDIAVKTLLGTFLSFLDFFFGFLQMVRLSSLQLRCVT